MVLMQQADVDLVRPPVLVGGASSRSHGPHMAAEGALQLRHFPQARTAGEQRFNRMQAVAMAPQAVSFLDEGAPSGVQPARCRAVASSALRVGLQLQPMAGQVGKGTPFLITAALQLLIQPPRHRDRDALRPAEAGVT